MRLPGLGALPREHGTWAMLGVPWLVGCAVAGRVGVRAGLVLLGGLALFLAQNQLAAWYRGRRRAAEHRAGAEVVRRLLVLGALGVALMTAALHRLPPVVPLVLGVAGAAALAASLLLIDRGLDHALPGQVLAATALTLVAPAAYLAAGGVHLRHAVALWALNAAFFVWSVFYVRLEILALARRTPLASVAERVAFAAPTLLVDLALAAVVVAALRAGDVPAVAAAAFAPAALQSLAGVGRLARRAPLKRVGFLMLAHAVVFAILLVGLARAR
jgi:YwiC-like protein